MERNLSRLGACSRRTVAIESSPCRESAWGSLRTSRVRRLAPMLLVDRVPAEPLFPQVPQLRRYARRWISGCFLNLAERSETAVAHQVVDATELAGEARGVPVVVVVSAVE